MSTHQCTLTFDRDLIGLTFCADYPETWLSVGFAFAMACGEASRPSLAQDQAIRPARKATQPMGTSSGFSTRHGSRPRLAIHAYRT